MGWKSGVVSGMSALLLAGLVGGSGVEQRYGDRVDHRGIDLVNASVDFASEAIDVAKSSSASDNSVVLSGGTGDEAASHEGFFHDILYSTGYINNLFLFPINSILHDLDEGLGRLNEAVNPNAGMPGSRIAVNRSMVTEIYNKAVHNYETWAGELKSSHVEHADFFC